MTTKIASQSRATSPSRRRKNDDGKIADKNINISRICNPRRVVASNYLNKFTYAFDLQSQGIVIKYCTLSF